MIGNGQKHHGITVLGAGLILVPHLPVVFKLRGVVGRIVAVEIVHRHHGNLRVRLLIHLLAKIVQPRLGSRIQDAGKIVDIVVGMQRIDRFGGNPRRRAQQDPKRQNPMDRTDFPQHFHSGKLYRRALRKGTTQSHDAEMVERFSWPATITRCMHLQEPGRCSGASSSWELAPASGRPVRRRYLDPKFRMQFRRSPAKKPFWPRTPLDRKSIPANPAKTANSLGPSKRPRQN